jgi:hypothetical protein
MRLVLAVAAVASGVAMGHPVAVRAEEPKAEVSASAEKNPWTFDVTLFGLAAGMSGDVVARGIPADLDVGFDKIWDNLEMGAMGKVRVGYDRLALTTEVIYMGLGVSKNGVSADFDQWVVEPTLSYRVCANAEVLAGVRYNNLSGEIRGPGILPTPRVVSGTQDWWDPIIGVNLSLPMGKKWSFNVRGDIGGFGVGSDLTWQAFPYFNWQYTKWGSLQLGYRWVSNDYESGSGSNRFLYDVMSQGPQIGFGFHF